MNQLISQLQNDSNFVLATQNIAFESNQLTIIHAAVVRKGQFVPKTEGITFHAASFMKTQQENISLILKGPPILDEYSSNAYDNYYKNIKQKKPCVSLIEQIAAVIKQGISIQIINSEYPHGHDIYVAFVKVLNKWVISNQSQSVLFGNEEELNQLYPNLSLQLKKVGLFWVNLLKNQIKLDKLTPLLSEYTLCGKIAFGFKSVIWYCLVKTQLKSNICEDPFDALNLMNSAGLKTVRVKAEALVKNQDQIHRIIDNLLQATLYAHCESIDHSFGRSKVYFVNNNSQQVIGGYNILTFEDMIFNQMKTLAIKKESTFVKINNLREFYQANIIKHTFRTTYPFTYFERLLENVDKIIKNMGIETQFIQNQWFYILKIALYLSIKRISIEKYSKLLIQSDKIKQIVDQFTIEQLGPVYCKTTIIYCFLTINKALKRTLSELLKAKFNELQQHFQVLEKEQKEQIFDINHFVDKISQSKDEHWLKHYYLTSNPNSVQLKSFKKQLQERDKDTFFKIIFIMEPKIVHCEIDENMYPFSIQMITDAYRDAYNSKKNARLLKQKFAQLIKVTQEIDIMRNYEMKNCKHLIEVNLQMQEQALEIINTVKGVISSKNYEEKAYYPLMARIQKFEQAKSPKFSSQQIQKIIKNSYFSVPTINIQKLQ